MKRAFSYIDRAVKDGKYLTKISYDLKEIIANYKGITSKEKALIYNTLYDVARECKKTSKEKYKKVLSEVKTFDTVLRAFRRVYRNNLLRQKRKWTKAALKSKDVVFFMCSKHFKPAKDHKDYQGKIYVDRYWRMKVNGKAYNDVKNYIEDNNIMTIQKVQGDPVYLTTRPYCRHYFIPLFTEDVLDGDTEGVTTKHHYTLFDKQNYYKYRGEVYEMLDKNSPCSEYNKAKKRRAI